MPSKQEGRTSPETYDQGKGSLHDCGTAVVRSALDLALRSVPWKRRHFHHQSRWRVTAIVPIAHADEDGDQIETWMIGQGQETRRNRRTVVRRAWDLC